jgi:hypothetical protein
MTMDLSSAKHLAQFHRVDVHIGRIIVSEGYRDNVVLISCSGQMKQFARVCNIFQMSQNKVAFLCEIFTGCKDYFTKPLQSLQLNICKISLPATVTETTLIYLDDMCSKCVALSCSDSELVYSSSFT